MFSFLLLIISIIILLFLPGYLLIWLLETRRAFFNSLEKFVLSLGLSIVILNFIILFLGKFNITLNRFSLLASIVVLAGIFVLIRKLYLFYVKTPQRDVSTISYNLSRSQISLIILILFLTFFIKTAYLKNTIFPTATDMGHHMYWAKLITETGELPTYQEREIIEINNNYTISQPEKIDDFIIGEHLIFAALAILSGHNLISAFPSLILFLINIFSLLAVFILSFQIIDPHASGGLTSSWRSNLFLPVLDNSNRTTKSNFKLSKYKQLFSNNLAIMSLFLIGPLYAISSSQAKFISGGVIGNTLGNFFIPLALYLYLKAFQNKNPWVLSLALFITAGLFYTHHLSAFMFLFIILFIALVLGILSLERLVNLILSYCRTSNINIFKNLIKININNTFKFIFSPQVIFTLILILVFLFSIYTPSYLNQESVDTAVGTPEKSTRTGLTLIQLKFSSGNARFVLGIIGFLLIIFIRRKLNIYSVSLLFGWTLALLIMSLKPHWLLIDIPSNRIASYISYPLALTGALAFSYVFFIIKNNNLIPKKLVNASLVLIILFLFTSGLYDNSQSLNEAPKANEALKTFATSNYLAKNLKSEDVVLKDHNYIVADAWIKLFFMRDYNFPFSRSFFKRYEDKFKKREMCTLFMISEPKTDRAKKCYQDTGVNLIMVNPEFDSSQFKKLNNFSKIYTSDEVAVFFRK